MHKNVPVTPAGYALLTAELNCLKQVERARVVKAIAQAREQGDLSANAAYRAAREEQGVVEGRITEAEDRVARAIVIDLSRLSGSQVEFGATVTVVDEGSGAETTAQIVGPDEAAMRPGCLSITARLARALIGKAVGDRVEVATPEGRTVYRVAAIGGGR